MAAAEQTMYGSDRLQGVGAGASAVLDFVCNVVSSQTADMIRSTNSAGGVATRFALSHIRYSSSGFMFAPLGIKVRQQFAQTLFRSADPRFDRSQLNLFDDRDFLVR